MKRVIINLILIILAFTVQSCVFPLLPFMAASPNLLLIVTFSIGFIYGRDQGMWYGFFAGILLDLFYSGAFGFYTLLFVVTGYFNGFFHQYYYADYITLPLILCLLNELVYNLYIYVFRFLIRGRMDILYYAREIMIPETICTIVTTLLIYRLFLFTSRRLEKMQEGRN